MKSLFCSAMAFITICMLAPKIHASIGTRGGGNVTAAEFSELADSLITKISILGPITVNGFKIDGDKMRAVFDCSKIFAVSTPLKLNGKTVNAINNPATLEIFFHEDVWKTLDAKQKMQLVIHEYIGLTFPQISDLNYYYSSQLLQIIQKNVTADWKVFCRLSVFNQSAPAKRHIVDEYMTWVRNGSVAEGALGDFRIQFSLKDSYMNINLTDSQGLNAIDTIQYVGHGLDFRTTALFRTIIDGQEYDTLKLECQEALAKTP